MCFNSLSFRTVKLMSLPIYTEKNTVTNSKEKYFSFYFNSKDISLKKKAIFKKHFILFEILN